VEIKELFTVRRYGLRILLGLIFISISVALWLFFMPPLTELTRTDILIFFVLGSLFFGVYLLSGAISLGKLRSSKGSRLIRRRLKGLRVSKKFTADKELTDGTQRDIYHNVLKKMVAGLDPSMDVSQTAEIKTGTAQALRAYCV